MTTAKTYYPWLVVALLIALYTSSFIDRSIMGLLVKPIRADLAITDTEVSLLAGVAFALMYTFASIPLGYFVDNGSRRVVIAVGCAVWSIMTAMCGLANSFGTLFAARLGVGIGEASLTPSSYSLLSDLFAKEKLARALSFFSLGIPIGSGLALLIGGKVVEYFGAVPLTLPLFGTPKPWQVVFIVVGIPGLLLSALTLLIVKEPARQSTKNAAGDVERVGLPTVLRYVFKNHGFYVSVIGAITLNGVFCYGANFWMPTFLQRVHAFSVPESGVFLGASILVLGIPGTLLSGWIADRMIIKGRSNAHIVVSMFYLTGTLVCGALGPIIPIKELSLVLIGGFGFFLFTWTGVATALIQLATPVRMRGQVSALYLFSVSLIGLSVGPTAMGAATDYLFKSDKAVGVSISLVGIIAMAGSIALMYRARKFLPETLTAKT